MSLFHRKEKERQIKIPEGLTRSERKRVKKIVTAARGGDGKPNTAQRSIPFERMFRDGMCRVRKGYYTKTIQYEDINYELATKEDQEAIFEDWCGFLNFFDSSVHFEFSFLNTTIDRDEFQKRILIPPAGDDFDALRKEYSQMLLHQYAQGNNGLMKTKYLTFGIYADSVKQAAPRLAHIQTDIINNFRQIGVYAYPLDGKERLKMMHQVFHIGDLERFTFSWDWLPESGLSVKDFIAPSSFTFGSRDMQVGGMYYAASLLKIDASQLNDETLKDFLNMESGQIATMRVLPENMRRAAGRGFINATDCADYLTKKGMPFRDAYTAVGRLVAACTQADKTLEELTLEELRAVSPLFEEDVYEALKLENCMALRASYGGPAVAETTRQIEELRAFAAQQTE